MSTQVLIRPVQADDLDNLYDLACSAGPGMTNFQPDKGLLTQKIAWSLDSFAQPVTTPGQQHYYFVMEDVSSHQVVGCCGIFAQAGGAMPFYSYKVAEERLLSKALNRSQVMKVLYLSHDHHEASEVASLFLAPAYRKDKNGEFLSRVRFLFMAAFRERFANKVIAEMRGVINEQGESPFWRGLGQHFFAMDFSAADKLCAKGQKGFIHDLMPHHPIYVALLDPEAQAVLGEVHPSTKPALAMLKREGFSAEGYVDIFDAGPTVIASRDHIRTIEHSVVAEVVIRQLDKAQAQRMMLANQKMAFRACVAMAQQETDCLILDAQTAALLNLQAGEQVRGMPFTL